MLGFRRALEGEVIRCMYAWRARQLDAQQLSDVLRPQAKYSLIAAAGNKSGIYDSTSTPWPDWWIMVAAERKTMFKM